jgi:hypothetical protein
MKLKDMIKYYDVSLVGNMKEITGEQFDIIQRAAHRIHEDTGLEVLVTNFYSNWHQRTEIPVYRCGKLIGYEIHKDGQIIALRGPDEPNNEIH